MKLGSPDAMHLTLTLDGYEFPDLRHDPYGYDLNWLDVSIHVQDGHGEATRRGPYLLTWEVEDLATWLQALADGRRVAPLEFIEPTLHFEPPQDPSSPLTIHVFDPDGEDRPRPIHVPVRAEQLAQAAEKLRTDLRTYPQRKATRSAS